MPETRIPCPMCGEMIVETARICRFCGEKFKRDGIRGDGIDAKFVKKFRGQVHALGGFWVFIALVVGGLAATILLIPEPDVAGPRLIDRSLALVFVLVAIVYLTIGILTFLKIVPAIYTGLVITYLSLAGNGIGLLATFAGGGGVCGNVIGILINAAVIVQAHRVIGWARQLREAGLEITVRPSEVV